MHTRRSSLRLQLDILTSIKEGVAKPTRIMFRTNINWSILKSNLRSLAEIGLIECCHRDSQARIYYKLTEKGLSLLDHIANVVALTSTDALK